MSQLLKEIKEALGPQSKEKLAKIEKENNIIRPYYIALCLLVVVVYILNLLNLLDVGSSIIIASSGFLIFLIWLFIKIIYPKIKQKELSDPGLSRRLVVIIIIGLLVSWLIISTINNI